MSVKERPPRPPDAGPTQIRGPATRSSAGVAGIVRELVLVGTAVALYFSVRGLIDGREPVAYRNAEHVVKLEQSAGFFAEPTLQGVAVRHGWLAGAANSVYIYGHWPVLAITVMWLLVRHRDAYRRFRDALLISGSMGLVIFATFPVAPPRFLPTYGFIDTITMENTAYRLLQPPAFVNQYAAVPSLHLGWNLLAGIAWAGLAGHWLARLFGWLMPLAMLAAIVLTANHYLFDAAAGATIALLGLLLAVLLARCRNRRARSAALARSTAEPPPQT
jgi:hypothetical protein